MTWKYTINTFVTAQKMKFSNKDFFSKYDQIRSFLWICSHLLKKSFMENFIFCAVAVILVSQPSKTLKSNASLLCKILFASLWNMLLLPSHVIIITCVASLIIVPAELPSLVTPSSSMPRGYDTSTLGETNYLLLSKKVLIFEKSTSKRLVLMPCLLLSFEK